MRTLTKTETIHVQKDGIHIIVNDKPWGFTMTDDEGRNWIVRHCRKIGVFIKEYGFYIPAPLANIPILFEVHLNKFVQYYYRPDEKQRLMKSGDDVFVSLSRLECVTDAEHIPKIRRK